MAAVSTEFSRFAGVSREAQPSGGRTGWLSRLLRSVQDSRLRAAERDVAQFIALRGGRMTDSLERDIERRFV